MLQTKSLSEEIRRVTINGRDFDLDVARNKLLPVVRGGSDVPPPTPPPAPQPQLQPQPAPAPQPDLTALQAELDKAKNAGSTEALETALKALGFDKIEDAQTWVTAKREEETAQLTELEKREKAANDAAAAAAQREADAAKLIERGVIREALRDAGCPADNLADAEKLIDVTGDVTADSAKTAAEALKAKPAFASLFTVIDPGKPPPAPNMPPSPKPPAPSDPLAAGKARAEAAKKNRVGATQADLLNDFSPKSSPFANSVT